MKTRIEFARDWLLISPTTLLSIRWILIGGLICLVLPVCGDVSTTGNVSPSNPSAWTSSTISYVGETSDGTMRIDGGSVVSNNYTYLGYNSGTTGSVMVDGADSTWHCDHFSIGSSGRGEIHITNGGSFNSSGGGFIGGLRGSSGVVAVDGVDSTCSVDGFQLGYWGDGLLRITNGGYVNSSYINIGSDYLNPNEPEHDVDWTGELIVDGADSKCITGERLNVGYGGHGKLTITNGGFVQSNTSEAIVGRLSNTGTVTVDGTGSQWLTRELRVGYSNGATGSMDITNGGYVSSRMGGALGFFSGASGRATVDGAGSLWEFNASLVIGEDSTGILNITNGGAVKGYSDGYYYCRIGYDIGSTGTVNVDGPGSLFKSGCANYHDGFEIGYRGNGTMTITNGGIVDSTGVGYAGYCSSYIGHYEEGTGIVTVNGSGSTWMTNALHVGYEGSGALNIFNDGLVSVSKALEIGDDGSIYMGGGGMLALYGDADETLAEFLDLIDGTDAICFWDESLLEWSNIMNATIDEDYFLTYYSDGDLAGYTMLTATSPVPEPATLTLLGLGILVLKRRK